MRRAFFLLAAALVFSGMAVVAALFGLNFFLNTGLLLLINRQPERLWMGWRSAWTWDAQHVEVDGYSLRVQGPLDQWWLTVDHAQLVVELWPLLERRFQADDLHAQGVVMRYRGRVDAPPGPGRPVPSPYVEGRTAPIPGLENPPLRPPESLYPPPPAPWLVALDDIEVSGLRELWLGDYRFVGTAFASGDLIVMPGSSLDVSDVTLEIPEGEIDVDGIPVVSDLTVAAEASFEGVDPVTDAGTAIFRHLDATVLVGGHVDDLRYLDIFLSEAPWVGISGGSGRLDATLDIIGGVLGPLTQARAVVQDVSAHLGSYSAIGDATIRVTIDRMARMGVRFSRFSVHQGVGAPIVRGKGFRLDAVTAALRLDEPPTGFVAVATLPRSDVPDLRTFDRYLPGEVGLRIAGGHATVEGHARVEEDGDRVSGALDIHVPVARLTYAGIPIVGSARVVGKVVDGHLDAGRYDIRGSSFAVRDVSVDGRPATWWARLDVREGRVAASAETFLTTRSDFACSDSSPFFRIAVGDRKIAPWVEKLVTLRNLEGEARASFGQTSLSVDHLHIHTPKAELHLHLHQRGADPDALLYARLGILGVATRVKGDAYTVQLIDAKKWFYARLAEAGTPEDMTSITGRVTTADALQADDRKGIQVLGQDVRNLFRKKDPAERAAAQAAAAERAANRKAEAEAARAAKRAQAAQKAAEKKAARQKAAGGAKP